MKKKLPSFKYDEVKALADCAEVFLVEANDKLVEEKKRSARLLEALKIIACAQVWHCVRDEHNYSGIDAGYAGDAQKAIAAHEKSQAGGGG